MDFSLLPLWNGLAVVPGDGYRDPLQRTTVAIEHEDDEARKGGMIRGWSSRGRYGPQEDHSRACAGDRAIGGGNGLM